MEKFQNELRILEEEHRRLTQAKARLQGDSDKATQVLSNLEQDLPNIMVAAALGEIPTEMLVMSRTEIKKQREIVQGPTGEAVKIIEARIMAVSDKMANIHRNISATKNKTWYQAARSVITEKGFYTVQEMDELERLASNSGEGQDLRRFIRAIDEYRGRREQNGQTPEFPPFRYIPENLTAQG